VTDKLHVDATIVAANRMAELQAENEQLRSKLAEYELLLAVAIAREDPCLAHTFVGDVCCDCGLVAPRVVDGVRQCPWVLEDDDPEEGYWNCKHPDGHDGVHETEFGAGRNREWTQPQPPTGCACSPKYRELAPGVHAAYCPLAGRPT